MLEESLRELFDRQTSVTRPLVRASIDRAVTDGSIQRRWRRAGVILAPILAAVAVAAIAVTGALSPTAAPPRPAQHGKPAYHPKPAPTLPLAPLGFNPQAVYSHQKVTQSATGNRQYLSAKSAGAFVANTTGTFGNLSRNAFRQPAYYDVDAAVTRIFPIHERLALNIRLEAFNLLNHPNFNGFTTALNSSTFGYATTAQPARIFQLAGKLTF